MADDPKPTDPVDPPADPKDPKNPDDLKEIEVPEGADDALKETIKKRNSELRNLRERMKAAEEKAKKFDELEESQKSETEKLADKVAKAEKKAQEAELRALRAEVAADKGLTPAQAKRITGTTLGELQADADEFLESIRPEGSGDGTKPPGKPTEHLKPGGGDPTGEPTEMNPAKLAEDVPRL